MTTQDKSTTQPAENSKEPKLIYQAPFITELQINELTQSATEVMAETLGGYYS